MAERHRDPADILGLAGSDEIRPEDVEARRDELIGYLDGAPEALRDRMGVTVGEVEDAAAHLLAALSADGAREATAEGEPTVSVTTAPPADTASALAELGEDDDTYVPTAPSVSTPSTRPRAAARRGGDTSGTPLGSRVILGMIAVAACVICGLAIYAFGHPSTTGTPEASPSATSADGGRSASDLAQMIVDNRKAIDADPTNWDAHMKLGIALFESGDLEGAKTEWDQVVAADPDNAQVHYNLGFWYLSQDTPDTENAEREWDRVVELAPDSELAQIVSMHRQQGALTLPSPSSSETTSPDATPTSPHTP